MNSQFLLQIIGYPAQIEVMNLDLSINLQIKRMNQLTLDNIDFLKHSLKLYSHLIFELRHKMFFFNFQFNAFREVAFQNASKFDKDEIQNSTILRMLKFVGMQPLDESSEFALSNTIVEMGKIYGSTKICPQTAKSGILKCQFSGKSIN